MRNELLLIEEFAPSTLIHPGQIRREPRHLGVSPGKITAIGKNHCVLAPYPRETQEMVFDAHARGFAFFGGVPLRGIYDNMKTAVTTDRKSVV